MSMEKETVERILDLAKKKGVKQSFLSDLIGGYRGKITDWKNGKSKPSSKDLELISDFFGVSVNYLLTGKNDKQADKNTEQELSEQAMRVAELFDSLDEKSQAKAEGFLAALADQNKP